MRPPFPGMDPWLEHPEIWRGIHLSLMVSIADELASRVAPDYYVEIEQQIYMARREDSARVGHSVVANRRIEDVSSRMSVVGRSPSQISDYTERDVRVLVDEEVKIRHIEIHEVESREVVTAIALLSPITKIDRRGRKKYLAKRQDLFESLANFVEIDLLRAGWPMPFEGEPARADYRILIARSEHLPRAKLRGFNVRRPIPPVPIPLRAGEPEPDLDLNGVLHGVYDRARYDLRIDYSTPPAPPLRDQDAEWAEGIVKEMQTRS